ncbi:MAG: LytR C-terminal domain-containing protein [bacterium]
MKAFLIAIVLGAVAVILGWLSYGGLSQKPIGVFLLEESPAELDAFQINLFLSGDRGQMKQIALTPAQTQQLREAFDQKDLSQIREIDEALNGGNIIVGVQAPLGNWPWFMGGGLSGMRNAGTSTVFDNLSLWDKLYLALVTRAPLGLAVGGVPVATRNVSDAVSGVTPVPLAAVQPAGVRIKILNGCGITNAADWAAGRMKGPGIVITAVTNADGFHYAKTLVSSSVGEPVALADALNRLGLGSDRVTEMTEAQGDADVVVIVGRDYLSLRGKKRVRNLN